MSTTRQSFTSARFDSLRTHPIPGVIVNGQYQYDLSYTGSDDMPKVNGTANRRVPYSLNLSTPNGRTLKVSGPVAGTFAPANYGKKGADTRQLPASFISHIQFGYRLPMPDGNDLWLPIDAQRDGKHNGLPQWKASVAFSFPKMEVGTTFTATLIEKAASGDVFADESRIVSYASVVAARLPVEVHENGTELVPA